MTRRWAIVVEDIRLDPMTLRCINGPCYGEEYEAPSEIEDGATVLVDHPSERHQVRYRVHRAPHGAHLVWDGEPGVYGVPTTQI